MRRAFLADIDGKTIDADEVRVGSMVIRKTEDGTGLWIGNGVVTPCVALFHMGGDNVGVAVYPPGTGPIPGVCLGVDENGAGQVQFGSGDRVINLTFDMVEKLVKLLEGN